MSPPVDDALQIARTDFPEQVHTAAADMIDVQETGTSLRQKRFQAWSGAYYVESAIYRIRELTGHEFAAYSSSPMGPVRDAWNEAFDVLEEFLAGTIPGTTTVGTEPGDDSPTT